MENSGEHSPCLLNDKKINSGGYEPNCRGQEMQTALLQNFEKTRNTITSILKKWDASSMQNETSIEGKIGIFFIVRPIRIFNGRDNIITLYNSELRDIVPSSTNKTNAAEQKWMKNVKSLYKK